MRDAQIICQKVMNRLQDPSCDPVSLSLTVTETKELTLAENCIKVFSSVHESRLSLSVGNGADRIERNETIGSEADAIKLTEECIPHGNKARIGTAKDESYHYDVCENETAAPDAEALHSFLRNTQQKCSEQKVGLAEASLSQVSSDIFAMGSRLNPRHIRDWELCLRMKILLADTDQQKVYHHCSLHFQDWPDIGKLLDSPLYHYGYMLSAPQKQEGFIGTLIIAPEPLKCFFYVLLMYQMTDEAWFEGTSIWKNKIGEKIAADSLTLLSCPILPSTPITKQYTAQGEKLLNRSIIENGKLIRPLLSREKAEELGIESAGELSEALMILSGSQSIKQIIAQTKNGLLMYGFDGTESTPDGHFSGIARKAFIIRNGKIDAAAEDMAVSGYWPEILQGCIAFSSETEADGVSSMPYMAIPNIKIGC